MDPTDGRPYVALGKLLLQQKRVEEARKLYDDGSAATGKRGNLQGSVLLSTHSCIPPTTTFSVNQVEAQLLLCIRRLLCHEHDTQKDADQRA